MKFSVSPVVRVAVKAKKAQDHTALIKGLKEVAKTDPCVVVTIDVLPSHLSDAQNTRSHSTRKQLARTLLQALESCTLKSS